MLVKDKKSRDLFRDLLRSRLLGKQIVTEELVINVRTLFHSLYQTRNVIVNRL